MKLKCFCYALLVSLASFSCEPNIKEPAGVKILPFEERSKAVDFSALSDHLEIIPLNLPDSIVLGRIHDIRYYGDHLFLHDKYYAKALYVFDEEGNFVDMLHRHGSGPGEYVGLDNYIIRDDVLTVYDRTSLQGVKYQLPGFVYLETVKVDSYFMGDVLSRSDRDYAIGISDDYGQDGFYKGIVFLNENYKSLHHIEKPLGIVEASEKGSLSDLGNEMLYAEPFSELIYRIDSMSLVPLYHVDFGRYRLPEKARQVEEAEDFYDIISTQDYAFAIHQVNIKDSVVSFNFYWRDIDDIRLGIYDLKQDKGAVINDVGPLQDYLTPPLSISNGYNLSILYPDEYDSEVLAHMNLTRDEVATIDQSKPLLVRYSINKLPNQ